MGDSRITIPKYISDNHNNIKFDVIFIDGGHDYDIANSDLINCFHLAHKNTIVILDDTIFINGHNHSNTIGPTRTWLEHLHANKITELTRKEYCSGRGMVWGYYNNIP